MGISVTGARLIHVLICAFRNEAVITVTTNVITATKIYGNNIFLIDIHDGGCNYENLVAFL
jgi:hypothetical protein